MEMIVGILVDVAKSLITEFLKWAGVGIATYVLTKLPGLRNAADKLPGNVTFLIIASIVMAGFLSSSASIVYTNYKFDNLGYWGESPDQPRASNTNGGYGPIEVVCPKGSYVVGVRNWGNSSGKYCIGCFVGVQVICRKIV